MEPRPQEEGRCPGALLLWDKMQFSFPKDFPSHDPVVLLLQSEMELLPLRGGELLKKDCWVLCGNLDLLGWQQTEHLRFRKSLSSKFLRAGRKSLQVCPVGMLLPRPRLSQLDLFIRGIHSPAGFAGL